MIPHGVEIFVGLEPIDLRWGFERLAGLMEEKLGRQTRSGALFVFFGKRRTALKRRQRAYSGHADHRFRPMPITRSGASRTPG